MTRPAYQDEWVTLYQGDYRELLPLLNIQADLLVTDPPYGETSLAWDHWLHGWPSTLDGVAPQMWCFGSMRMFLDHHEEFRDKWRMSQDVVWEKHNGSGFQNDRFKRVHEHAVHWYSRACSWDSLYRETPTTSDATARTVRRKQRPPHMGDINAGSYTSVDGGPKLMRSVIYARSMHGRAINETEKPTGLLEPLIQYGCPPGGLVVDPFAGSASTLVAARAVGRRAIGFELRGTQCAKAATRLAHQVPLDFGEPA